MKTFMGDMDKCDLDVASDVIRDVGREGISEFPSGIEACMEILRQDYGKGRADEFLNYNITGPAVLRNVRMAREGFVPSPLFPLEGE